MLIQPKPGTHELYVYWRTAGPGWHQAASALGDWQAALCAATPGLQGRWLRRVDVDPASITLMEIWLHPAGIDVETARRITDDGQSVLARWLSGARHVETFVAD